MSVGRRTAEFRDKYMKDDVSAKSCIDSLKKFRCNKKRVLKCANSLVPAYRIMRDYQWRSDVIKDLICGITIGIMQLPQGMAYAMLADVPPVVGLYMSCFPVFVYSILGTSRHVSMGTVTMVSLLTGSVIAKFYSDFPTDTEKPALNNETLNDNETHLQVEEEHVATIPPDVKIGIVVTLTFLVGVVQILMGTLRLGLITTYMSDPLVSGFTTAAGIYGGSGQLKHIFGIKIPRAYGLFQIVKMYKAILERISTTNFATLAVSCVAILTLYLVKTQINQRFKDKLKLPIPIELIVVIIATIASYFGKFNEDYSIAIVGNIPAGLPYPAYPSFKGVGRYISDVFTIAVISYAQSVSVAAVLAQKHGYTIHPNQELIAAGVSNIFGSVFHCYAVSASVARTFVADATGGKTQLYNIFSASLVLIVILWIGPLFEPLPKCVLSSVVLVALRCLVLQVLELPRMWRTSKYDFFTWIVTCLGAVILTADYGLLIGLLFSFFTVVLRSQLAKPRKVAKIEHEHIYKDTNVYSKTSELTGITIIRYQSPLYFANANFFVRDVYRLSKAKPEQIRKQRMKLHKKNNRKYNITPCTIGNSTTNLIGNESFQSISSISNSTKSVLDMDNASDTVVSINDVPYPGDTQPGLLRHPLSHIILDFSGISFVDTAGCKKLKQLILDYEDVEIQVFLADVSDDAWEVFKATEVIPTYQNHMFLTVDDAVLAAKLQISNRVKNKQVNLSSHL